MSPPQDTGTCPVNHKETAAAACPVDHAAWSNIQPHSSDNLLSSSSLGPSPTPTPRVLSNSREVSSIPRNEKENWVYPSEAQFYAAMARKNHDPKAPDMSVVVPIHNAVNERAWSHIQQWEAGRGGERCGGIRLVSFKGKPGERSPKARILSLLGCVSPPHRSSCPSLISEYLQVQPTVRQTRLGRGTLRNPRPLCDRFLCWPFFARHF